MPNPRGQIYGGRDPREIPSYSYADAHRILRIPYATIRAWMVGTSSFDPVIVRPFVDDPRLSFLNLVECQVLRALRTKHTVSMPKVREALGVAERELRIERLLIRKELRTTAGRLFLVTYGQLIELSRSGQMHIEQVLRSTLKRVRYDAAGLSVALFPAFVGQIREESVVVNPRIGFGAPTVTRRGIRTAVIVDRIDAGESVLDVAEDYGLDEDDILDAIGFEQAAA